MALAKLIKHVSGQKESETFVGKSVTDRGNSGAYTSSFITVNSIEEVCSYMITAVANGVNSAEFILEGSNDVSTWTTVAKVKYTYTSGARMEIRLGIVSGYKHYRFRHGSASNTGAYTGYIVKGQML